MLTNLSAGRPAPQYKRILSGLVDKIEAGMLMPGERLLSTRDLAEKLGVHRSTVMAAYQELWALGYIEMSAGRRPTVRQRPRVGREAQELYSPPGRLEHTLGGLCDEDYQGSRADGVRTDHDFDTSAVDFTRLLIDPRLYPVASFRSCLSAISTDEWQHLLGYGDPVGYRPLREYLSRYLNRYGIAAGADNIFITNGSQHGLNLILQLLASPGRSVVIESPTYKEFIMLIQSMNLKPVCIPMTSAGMDLDILEEHLENCAKDKMPALIYTMPNFQNPTGSTTGQLHRERLLRIAEKYLIPIVEDGFQEDMKYHGKVTLPIKSMDSKGIVLYCSSFSKILFPGLRVGWIVADASCVRRFSAMRHINELSPNCIMQAAVHRFCTEGHFDRHISRMHRTFRKRMDRALGLLDAHISRDWAAWVPPVGGYLIWLRLLDPPGRQGMTEYEWETAFRRCGIQLRMGSAFYYDKADDNYIRLSIAALNEEEITLGIERLSRLLEQLHTRSSNHPGGSYEEA